VNELVGDPDASFDRQLEKAIAGDGTATQEVQEEAPVQPVVVGAALTQKKEVGDADKDAGDKYPDPSPSMIDGAFRDFPEKTLEKLSDRKMSRRMTALNSLQEALRDGGELSGRRRTFCCMC
jgi:hypothetical protein